MSKPLTVHMIGNAHLDPVWLWDWRAGLDAAISTCRSAADLLDAYPEFVFTRGESWLHEQIERVDPPLFERIRGLVEAGRWQLVNGWYVQPDCNLPTAEAFGKQIEIGQGYFRDRFGRTATVGYNVDSFGHAAILPNLLASAGYDSYVFMRPMANECELPSNLFRWRSPAGGEVLAYRIPVGYTTRVDDLREHIEQTLAERPGQVDHVMCFFGVGNHGGGPTRRQIEFILENRSRFENAELIFSHPRAFFDAIADRKETLPVVEGELQFHAIGCYSALRSFKRPLVETEYLAIQAEQVAQRFPDALGADAGDRITRAWRHILFNQFHDTVGGTCIRSAYQDARDQVGAARADLDECIVHTTRRWAASLPPSESGQDILVINPSPAGRGCWIEHEPWTDWLAWDQRRLVDDRGREIHYQQIPPAGFIDGIHRILFPVIVPPGAHRRLSLLGERPSEIPPGPTVADRRIESDQLRVTVGSDGIADVLFPPIGAGLLSGEGISLMVCEDLSDTWTHGVDRFTGKGLGHFEWDAPVVAENGPLRVALRSQGRFGASTGVLTVRMYHSEPWFELHVRVNWQQPHALLKLDVPVAGRIPGRRDAVSGLWLDRPCDGREVPYHGATLLAVEAAGQPVQVGLLAPHTYSLDVDERAARVTFLRSPAYAHHEPRALRPSDEVCYTDLGEHAFTVRIWPASHLEADDLDAVLIDMLQPVIVLDRF